MRRGIDYALVHDLAAKVDAEYSICMTEDCPDRELTDRVKWTMENRIPQGDRDILILYADRQSYRETGRELGCAHELVRKHVIRARSRLLEELEKI